MAPPIGTLRRKQSQNALPLTPEEALRAAEAAVAVGRGFATLNSTRNKPFPGAPPPASTALGVRTDVAGALGRLSIPPAAAPTPGLRGGVPLSRDIVGPQDGMALGNDSRKRRSDSGIYWGTDRVPMVSLRPRDAAAYTADKQAVAFLDNDALRGPKRPGDPRWGVSDLVAQDRQKAAQATADAQNAAGLLRLNRGVAVARGAGDPTANRERDMTNLADMGDKFTLGRPASTNQYARLLGGVAGLRMGRQAAAAAGAEAQANRDTSLRIAEAKAKAITDKAWTDAESRAGADIYNSDTIMGQLTGELMAAQNDKDGTLAKEGKVRPAGEIMRDLASRQQALDTLAGNPGAVDEILAGFDEMKGPNGETMTDAEKLAAMPPDARAALEAAKWARSRRARRAA